MDKARLLDLDQAIVALLHEARAQILAAMKQPLTVAQKSDRKDLVTNVDRANEQFLVKRIRQLDPGCQILGEEGLGDSVTAYTGHTWVVDPIDGTMNFVKQQDHFAIMIGVFDDGVNQLGYIFDVMENHLYHGGPQIGVFIDQKRLLAPENRGLADGLIGASGPLVVHDDYQMQTIVQASAGMRIYGSAGIEIIHVLRGQSIGYISYLKPWDFAAGKVLLEALGLWIGTVDGQPLNMLSSNAVLVATMQAQHDILQLVKN